MHDDASTWRQWTQGATATFPVAVAALPWLPQWLHFLGKNRFESARKLASVRSPVLISHGDPDTTIPTKEAHALFASANEPKKLLIIPGAGHVVFSSAGEPYLNQVEEFIRGGRSVNVKSSPANGS